MALSSTILAQQDGSFWMPAPGSTVAGEVDWAFYLVFWISVGFFALIVGLMVLFLIRYRRRKGHRAEPSAEQNMALELTWSIIPVILVIVIFSVGFRTFIHMVTPPANAYEIYVTGQKWNWTFEYPNGYIDSKLHVPVDTPIKLTLSSEDVIHSLFIPAFRVKKDAVPGRYNQVWFQATSPGEYVVFCAEYCGTGHSDMITTCVVHEPGEFEKWLADAANFLDRTSPAEGGQMLYKSRGCAQCHTVDGTARIGPSFKGIFGKKQVLQDGSSVTIDENYIRESILEPQAKIAAGYEPVMPTYQGRLKDREVTAIIAYIKSLGDEAPATGEKP